MKRLVTLLAGLSLGALAGNWLSSPPTPSNSAPTTPAPDRAQRSAAASLSARPAPPRFRANWSSLESTNYSEYIGNLRAIHTPEAVVVDIIRADLIATCVRKAPLIPSDGLRRTLATGERTQELQRQYMDFGNQVQQVDDILTSKLGLQRLEADGYFLTSEHFRLIKEARRRHPRLPTNTADPASMEAAAQNLRQRAAFLEPNMNSDQMIAYKVVYEGYGDTISRTLRSFRPTELEFRAMVNGMPDASERGLVAILPSILGPDRLAAYQHSQELHMRRLHDEMQAAQLSPAAQAATLELVAGRDRMSSEEFRSRLRALVPKTGSYDSIMNAIGR